MTIFNIELAGLHTVGKAPRDGSWSASYSIELAKLPESVVARLALHGLTQKLADAASGAKTKDEAFAAMAKAGDALLAGQWAVRTAGAGAVSDEMQALVNLVGKAIAGKDKAKGKEFNQSPMADKLAIAENNRGKFTPERITEEVERIVARREELAAQREANAALANEVEIDF